jgi:pilus assembly protein Flp/PilA
MKFTKLIKNEDGATAIEYGLLAAMIAMACVVAFQMLGLDLGNIFTTIARAMGAKI